MRDAPRDFSRVRCHACGVVVSMVLNHAHDCAYALTAHVDQPPRGVVLVDMTRRDPEGVE